MSFPNFAKRPMAALMVAIFVLSGCQVSPHRPAVDPKVERPDVFPDVRRAQEDLTEGTVDLDVGFNPSQMFLVRKVAGSSGQLPNMRVSNFSLSDAGIGTALRMLFQGTGYSVKIEGSERAGGRYEPVSISNLSGNLPDIVEDLSRTVGFFYSINGNSITIQNEQQFVIELPPILGDDNMAGMVNTIQYMGARDTYLDRMNRTVIFRANPKVLSSIESYMSSIRESRAMLIYNIYIYQVDLNDSSTLGINWTKFAGTSTNNALPANTALAAGAPANTELLQASVGSSGIETLILGPKFSMLMLINFLQTQGTVKTVSVPRIAMMSGSRGALRVGQTLNYVSRVGTNFSTSLNQTTVETSSLRTGLEMQITGDVNDKTIYSNISMQIVDLMRMNSFKALGTDINQPLTTDRDIRTSVRTRPGDTILLGGLTSEAVSKNNDGGTSGVNSATSLGKSELVMAISTRLVRFVGKLPDGREGRDARVAVAAPTAMAPALSPIQSQRAIAVAPAQSAVPTPVAQTIQSPEPRQFRTSAPETSDLSSMNVDGDRSASSARKSVVMDSLPAGTSQAESADASNLELTTSARKR